MTDMQRAAEAQAAARALSTLIHINPGNTDQEQQVFFHTVISDLLTREEVAAILDSFIPLPVSFEAFDEMAINELLKVLIPILAKGLASAWPNRRAVARPAGSLATGGVGYMAPPSAPPTGMNYTGAR